MNEPTHRTPEAEIIPPGAPLPSGSRVWATNDTRGAQRVYTTNVGPVGFALLTVVVGAVAALAIVFLLGLAVFGFAAIGVLTIVGVIAGLLRGPSRPLR